MGNYIAKTAEHDMHIEAGYKPKTLTLRMVNITNGFVATGLGMVPLAKLQLLTVVGKSWRCGPSTSDPILNHTLNPSPAKLPKIAP